MADGRPRHAPAQSLEALAVPAVEIGDKTFAEHIDTISETPEAKQLVGDTRATINPALVEIRDRVLGEYVEAPTWIPDQGELTTTAQPAVERRHDARFRQPVSAQSRRRAAASGPARVGQARGFRAGAAGAALVC
ncbi:MAG: hypothetical protein R6X02_23200 [Enhygromyxa sp.]